jgi:hypothetical protein
VFNQFIAYRDKEVVGVLCVFRAPLQPYETLRLRVAPAELQPDDQAVRRLGYATFRFGIFFVRMTDTEDQQRRQRLHHAGCRSTCPTLAGFRSIRPTT